MTFDKPQPKKETLTELHKKRFKGTEEYNDLYNEEVVRRIVLEGTDEERENLRQFHKISPERFELFLHYERLRHQTVQQCFEEAEKRKQTNPEFTDIEKQIADNKTPNQIEGVYLEYIEPQVRQAVITLSNKGYISFESGFGGDNRQIIGFNSEQLSNYKPSDELITWLESKKAEIKIEPNSITFSSDEKLTLDELKEIWDRIVADVPERKK
ncbi:hypothetical protein HN858_03210 [Candidatus Falkowbacteria bacterium]|jgi:hypothetical protein|nr:hypothetical protein [Candidatus Falkowbacteria bacterium]MBT5503101.1 hypothetical protein [Candidatus Falkowbacteria bacterium]MBT6574195.1 hypothetical protein [Candidatus Falkowbacteria bacterium]MBT7348658.1 hypothetical protein [Candidatus Falkowbacteria bacterium]MBT7500448.1 hypothetical protein [Candidatus Falkowbacteria bacterium]